MIKITLDGEWLKDVKGATTEVLAIEVEIKKGELNAVTVTTAPPWKCYDIKV